MLTALLLLVGSANAQQGPYMWGAGAAVTTIFYPTRYPGTFPTALTRGDTATWDFEENQLDVGVAGRGVFYLNGDARLGARVGLAGGAGWNYRYLDLEFDRILTANSGFHLFVGAGAGLGGLHFTDQNADELEVNAFLVRAQFGGVYRNKTQAYEAALYAGYPIPLDHRIDPTGADEQIRGAGSRYGQIGVEVSVLFGDFTPPRKKKGGKKKGGRRL